MHCRSPCQHDTPKQMLFGGRLGLSGSAVAVFEDMRRRGLWAAEDTYCVNLLLDALSDDSAAAFATCEYNPAPQPTRHNCA